MELPPKECEIDRLVTREADVAKVISGQKTSQRRNGRYADLGERWTLGGQAFEITAVYQQALGEMTDEHARAEGYASMDEYQAGIMAMHKGMPWMPHAKVWVHEWRHVGQG